MRSFVGWSLLLGPLSHCIFLCVQSHNGVTHSPTWGIWGLVLFYLQLLEKISDITEVTKNYSKDIQPTSACLRLVGRCRPEVIAKGFGMWGLGQTWPTFAKAK